MPEHEHLVLCGGLDHSVGDQEKDTLRLSLHGRSRNVRLQIEDIGKRLLENIPDALIDLLDIAAYVHAADSAVSRGGMSDPQMGARWRRRFRFVVPVRERDLWAQDEISTALVETLNYLSDDDHQFHFEPLRERPAVEGYFPFQGRPEASFRPDEVVLFSGGLDSLAGTVEDLVAHRKAVALVSHRSSPKIVGAQDHLVRELRQHLGSDRLFHVPVRVDLNQDLTREFTHRTRSFLFAALGAVTARLFGVDRITFFENGVLSLNLPILGQIVGARATRTTHPQALAGFRRVLSLVVGQPFEVANPYRWLTKAEGLARIRENGFDHLIRHARSCTRVRAMTKLHPHCGRCSQCIDRRFAVLAAGLGEQDPAEAYEVDLFTGERSPGPDRELALAYIRSASAIDQMKATTFCKRFGEVSRAVLFFDESAEMAAKLIVDLHRRHGSAVCRVFDQALLDHAEHLRKGTLPPSCLLRLVMGQHEGETAYPEPVRTIEEPIPASPEIRMAIDGERVVFNRWGEITGVAAAMLIALAKPFREAARTELAPESYPFLMTNDLLVRLKCAEEETLRRRISRLRRSIERLASQAGQAAPPIDAVIETSPRHGYRLNPDSVRIVAPRELSRRK